MTILAINKINLNAATQLRLQGESMSHIRDLAIVYAEKGAFKDKPVVGHVLSDNSYVPIDGFHRLMAIEWLSSDDFKNMEDAPHTGHLDLTKVDVEVVTYETLTDAIIAAAGVNTDHGLKRTSGDVRHAIETLLEVEPMRFMDGKYKLNKKAIMEAVKCGNTWYAEATRKFNAKLKTARTLKIMDLHDEGVSNREIANIVGVDHKTVGKIVNEMAGENFHTEKTPQPEETTQESPETPEETQSVFTHMTSVTPIDSPWEDEEETTQESSNTTEPSLVNGNQPRSNKMTDLELCKFLDGLSVAQQGVARNYLENL